MFRRRLFTRRILFFILFIVIFLFLLNNIISINKNNINSKNINKNIDNNDIDLELELEFQNDLNGKNIDDNIFVTNDVANDVSNNSNENKNNYNSELNENNNDNNFNEDIEVFNNIDESNNEITDNKDEITDNKDEITDNKDEITDNKDIVDDIVDKNNKLDIENKGVNENNNSIEENINDFINEIDDIIENMDAINEIEENIANEIKESINNIKNNIINEDNNIKNSNIEDNSIEDNSYEVNESINKIENNITNEDNSIDKEVINKNNKNIKNKNKNKNNKKNKERNKNNKSYIDVPAKKTDIEIIQEYKGGELEPEWEWAKSMSIVYTWVDGNNVEFLDIKSKYNNGYRTFNSRDRSADELRYSLRSVEKYMPWHNGTIFIVTANQIPKWLNITHERVKIIDHKDFIPEHYYPTYDSNTIELFLDKIPGITERFLYFNDDIFINNYIHPCFFFSSKNFYPKVYRRNIVRLNQEKTDSIINKNSVYEMFHASKFFTRKAIRDYFDPNFEYRYLLHTVYSLYRDLMEPFRQLFAEELKVVCSDRFRSYQEIHVLYVYQSYLFYATQHKDFPLKLGGNGKAASFTGKPLPPNRTIKEYSSVLIPASVSKKYIQFGSITNNIIRNFKKFETFKNDKNLLVYNFNDEYSKSNSLYQFTQYMINRYPEPTSFEKKEYVDLEISYQSEFKKTRIATEDEAKALDITLDELNSKYIVENLGIVNEYLDKKEALSEPQKEISQREEKEIDILMNYSGEEIKDEWEWISDISLVYVLSAVDKKCNCTHELDKLKYSLRSVDKYLTWHRGKIFIVIQSNSQKDELSWIDTSKESKIILISKDDLIPSSFNTNNKHVIEFYLDKIPGITERFIYLNSNHFFTYNIHPLFFFNNDYYPKYNLKNPESKAQGKLLDKKKDKDSFSKTYNLVFDYFHKNYVKVYRHLYEAPCPLYRDLFKPVRELYQKEWNVFLRELKKGKKTIDILPIYLIITYNIYGTEQPFYPEYIAGYGKVREAEPAVLNENRTINYYGYDVTSINVNEATMYPQVSFNKSNLNNNPKSNELLNSEKLFFSLPSNKRKGDSYNDLSEEISQLMNSLYEEKSTFEN